MHYWWGLVSLQWRVPSSVYTPPARSIHVLNRCNRLDAKQLELKYQRYYCYWTLASSWNTEFKVTLWRGSAVLELEHRVTKRHVEDITISSSKKQPRKESIESFYSATLLDQCPVDYYTANDIEYITSDSFDSPGHAYSWSHASRQQLIMLVDGPWYCC